MANKITLKRSSVPSKAPVAGDVEYGELALNYNDGKLFYKKVDNTIDYFQSGLQTITLTGAITGSGTGEITTTLSTTGATAGSYTNANITVGADGRITSVANGSTSGLPDQTGNTGKYLTTDGSTASWGAINLSGYQPVDADLTAIGGLTGTSGILTKTAANTWSLDTNTYLTTTNAASTYQPVDADLTSIAALSGTTGILKKTALNTWALDTTNYQPQDGDLTAIAGLAGTSGLLKKTAADTWTLDTSTYLTGITSGQVTTALGYTPYNSSNPNGYITSTASITGNAATATSSPLVSALGSYVWSASALPNSYNLGIQAAFVGPAAGEGLWQNYGSVMTMRTYSGGGGSLQMYVPYGPSNGGTGMQVRFGNYNVSSGNSWTEWKTLLASDNYNSYSPTLTGTGASGTWSINVTGNATNITGTVAIANGGTGGTTAQTARTNLGATTLGGNLFTLPNVAAISFPRINADNTVSSLDAATFRTAIGAGTSSTTGTVTSVAGAGTVSGLTLTGTVTTTGSLTLGGTLAVTASNFASQTANTVLAAPQNANGVPTFRNIHLSDMPSAWIKRACDAATTAALTLNTAQTTIDGVTLSATSRVLVKNQVAAAENGIYTGLTTTAWVRAADGDIAGDIAGAFVSINSGTVNGGKVFDNDFKSTDTLGTTAMNWFQNIDAGYFTTVGNSFATLTNPSAITFPRINADNTVSALNAATFRTAIGAGTSSTTGTVTSIIAGTGLSGGTISTTGTIALANTTVTAGSYTLASITVDAQGRITAASNGSASGGVTSFNTRTGAVTLSSTDVTTALGYTPLSTAGGTLTGNLIFANSTSPNSNYIQFGDNSGWVLRFMTSVSGTPTQRYAFTDTGNFTASANVTAYSDETLKTNWRNLPKDYIEQLAKVKYGTYDRVDIELTQDGISAQSLRPLLPNSIQEDEKGILSVNYGGAAMVSAVALAERVVEQDKRIAELERLIAKIIGD